VFLVHFPNPSVLLSLGTEIKASMKGLYDVISAGSPLTDKPNFPYTHADKSDFVSPAHALKSIFSLLFDLCH
jgi:hypothetical protein